MSHIHHSHKNKHRHTRAHTHNEITQIGFVHRTIYKGTNIHLIAPCTIRTNVNTLTHTHKHTRTNMYTNVFTVYMLQKTGLPNTSCNACITTEHMSHTHTHTNTHTPTNTYTHKDIATNRVLHQYNIHTSHIHVHHTSYKQTRLHTHVHSTHSNKY